MASTEIGHSEILAYKDIRIPVQMLSIASSMMSYLFLCLYLFKLP